MLAALEEVKRHQVQRDEWDHQGSSLSVTIGSL